MSGGAASRARLIVVASARRVRGAVVHRGPRGDRHASLAMVDSVTRSGLIGLDELTVAVGRRPGPAVRWVLEHADPRSESVLESLLRALLLDAGIAGIDLQVSIAGVGRVDMLIGGWLVVEADGFADHADREHYRKDRRRLDAQLRLGLGTLWFSYEDVVGAPAHVVATVRDVLERQEAGVLTAAETGGVEPAARTCAVCGRTITWRRKWARDWDNVRYCSAACRRHGVTDLDTRLEVGIRTRLSGRAANATICPSEVARELGGEGWRELMEPTRQAARRLVAAGEVEITQQGRVVDPSTAKGPIRIRSAGRQGG